MAKSKHSLTAVIVPLLVGLSLMLGGWFPPFPTVHADPGVLYAAPNAQGSGDCSSWANACTLQYALSIAVSGDEIWVKAGVHYSGAAGNREATFTLKNGVTLYGGFAGNETSRDQRDWQANPTILSGDIDQNDTNTDGNFIAETWNDIVGDNAYHVVTCSGMGGIVSGMDGFIITAGQANGSVITDKHGGGMYNSGCDPTLTNVIFSGNFAASFGGGIYGGHGSALTNVTFSSNRASHGGGMYTDLLYYPTLTNVTFSGNEATYGGGMYNWGSRPTLTNVTFSSNTASLSGGGMYNYQSNPTLTSVTFSGNTSFTGGGMYNEYSLNPTLTNVTFSGNTADLLGGGMYNTGSRPNLTNVIFHNNHSSDSGGGMYNKESDPRLTNVTFSGNTSSDGGGGGMVNYKNSNPTLTNVVFHGNNASGNGGGIYNSDNSSPTLTNVILYGNSASASGGGMYNYDNSNPTLTNVTFSGNTASSSGGGMYNLRNSSPSIRNSILWGNLAPTGPQVYNSSSSPTFSYSDIQGCGGSGGWDAICGANGGGNIDADPRFVDAAGGNLRLKGGSPAIDAGNNAAVPPGVTTDLDGNPRIDYIVDMGAYEYQAGPGPRPFGKTSPLDGDPSQPLTLILSWRASPLADTYAYCYDTIDNDVCDTTWISTTETLAQISGLAENTTYYWQVRAINAQGTTYADGGVWWSFTTRDTTAPTVLSSVRLDPSPTNAASVRFRVTFSEDVTGVDAADFSLTASGITGAAVTGVEGTGAAYTVTVGTGSGSGTLRLDVSATASINDLAGNPLTGLPYTGGESYTIDKTAPTVLSSVRLDPSPTNAASVRFRVTFSEDVTGVDAADFSLTVSGISGASVTGVEGAGAMYTVTVGTGSGSGTLRLDVPATASIADLAGNPLSGLPYTGGEAYMVRPHFIYLPLVLRNTP